MNRRYPIINQRFVSEFRFDENRLDFGGSVMKMNFATLGITKLAILILKKSKLLTPHLYETETVQTITVEYDKLVRFVTENHHELIKRYNIKDAVVLIGSAQWYEIMGSTINTPIFLRFSDSQSPNGGSPMLCGMLVAILPWMDGTVLIPKEYMPLDTKVVEVRVAMTPEMAKDERELREGDKAAMLWNQFMGRKIVHEVSEYED